MSNVGEVIKALRKKNKVTQQELSDVLNVSSRLISKWEAGLSVPDLSYIPIIADFFKVPATSIVTSVDAGNVVAKADKQMLTGNAWGEVLTQPMIDKLFGALKKTPPKGNKVLVADDAAFMRAYLCSILTKSGYEVVAEADNGREVIEAVKAVCPDIIIMDIVMPELDGLSALRRIKQINPDAVVVMCSSMVSQQVVLEVLDSGARWFIIKPFISEQFIACLGEL